MDPRFVKLQNGNKETILFATAQGRLWKSWREIVYFPVVKMMRLFISQLLKWTDLFKKTAFEIVEKSNQTIPVTLICMRHSLACWVFKGLIYPSPFGQNTCLMSIVLYSYSNLGMFCHQLFWIHRDSDKCASNVLYVPRNFTTFVATR
jgi:hypothetical protein